MGLKREIVCRVCNCTAMAPAGSICCGGERCLRRPEVDPADCEFDVGRFLINGILILLAVIGVFSLIGKGMAWFHD